MHRRNLRFESRGVACAATFYQADLQGPRPCVVMGHDLGATKEMGLPAYIARFTQAGYHAFAFDYRHFGASGGFPRQLVDLDRQLQDWDAAIHTAQRLPGVDAERVVLWGTSLAGGHVLATAAHHPRVAAVIAQVPHVSGWGSVRAAGTGHAVRMTLHGLLDATRARMGFRPHYVLSSGPPGAPALLNAPGASAGYLGLVPEGQELDRWVTARVALSIGRYSPGRHLPSLLMPALVQVALYDEITPSDRILVACRRARNVTVLSYEAGHFDVYVPPLFETVVADQVAFLRQQVPGRAIERPTAKSTPSTKH